MTSESQLGHGYFRYPLAIPALVGPTGYFQFNYYDSVSGRFGGTQATEVTVGN